MSTTWLTNDRVLGGMTACLDERTHSLALADARNQLEIESGLWRQAVASAGVNIERRLVPLNPIGVGETAVPRTQVSDSMKQEAACRNACCKGFATELLAAIRVELATTQAAIIDDITSKMQMRKLTVSTAAQTTSEALCSGDFSRMQVATCDKPADCSSNVPKTLGTMSVVEPQRSCEASVRGVSVFVPAAEAFCKSISLGELQDPPYPFYRHTRGFRGIFGWAQIERLFVLFYSLQEPTRTGWLYRFQASIWFELAFHVVVFGSFFFHIVRVNLSLGGSAEGQHMRTVSILFEILFAVECGIRIMASGWYYFVKDGMLWNWLDVYLVGMWIVDFASGNGHDTRVFRSLRLMKLLRALRGFKTLRMMLDTLFVSFASLFWSLVMLSTFCFMFGLIFCKLVDNRISHASLDDDGGATLLSRFGTVQEAALTLFASTTGGADWCETYEALAYIGIGGQLLFLFYVCFTLVAVLNIVTGVFVDSAFRAAELSTNERAEQLQNENREGFKGLLSMIRQHIVKDGSDSFTLQELEDSLTKQAVRGSLAAHGVSIHDPRFLLEVLMPNPKTERIDALTFASGCLALRGFASSTDSQFISFQVSLSHAKLRNLEDSIKRELNTLKKTVAPETPFERRVRRQESFVK